MSMARIAALVSLGGLLACTGQEGISAFDGGARDLASGIDATSDRQCHSASDCPSPAICKLCSDGSSVCASGACVADACTTVFPDCSTTPACKQDSDCPPVIGPMCMACPGGGQSCPIATCVNAQCTAGWSACPSGGVTSLLYLNRVTNDCHLPTSTDVSTVDGLLTLINHSNTDVTGFMTSGTFNDAASGAVLGSFPLGVFYKVTAMGGSGVLDVNKPAGTLSPPMSCQAIPCGTLITVTVNYTFTAGGGGQGPSKPLPLPCTP